VTLAPSSLERVRAALRDAALPTVTRRYDELWAAAGTPHDVFAVTADQLEAATGGRRASVRRG
jgi:hypothetical protein